MLQIRYDPVKNQKIAYSTKRQGRTFHPPKNYCPLCPTISEKVKTEILRSSYDIVVFENKFPTFSRSPDGLDFKVEPPYKIFRSKGICEVVCYTENHDEYLEDQSNEKIENIIKVWIDRYCNLGKKNFIKYVFIFENKGNEIGVTLSHPHGQIYAFSYIPPVIKEELKNSKIYYRKNSKCLHCEILKIENKSDRIIIENNDFISFIPYYARWPYEVHIYPFRHIGSLYDLKNAEIGSLAKLLKELISKYNQLFDFRMPYVMAIHQKPTDNRNYEYYHLHFEFYPPYRAQDKLKYIAGCELGTGTFINDTLPEDKAKELRKSQT